MSSLYEPCGLNQSYAMKYGTLPIVRATGIGWALMSGCASPP